MGCSGPAAWNKIYFSCTVPTSLCKLVGANLRPIWWLILMIISYISMHALFNSQYMVTFSESLPQSFSDLFHCSFFSVLTILWFFSNLLHSSLCVNFSFATFLCSHHGPPQAQASCSTSFFYGNSTCVYNSCCFATSCHSPTQ
jgi:hypothetical protein